MGLICLDAGAQERDAISFTTYVLWTLQRTPRRRGLAYRWPKRGAQERDALRCLWRCKFIALALAFSGGPNNERSFVLVWAGSIKNQSAIVAVIDPASRTNRCGVG